MTADPVKIQAYLDAERPILDAMAEVGVEIDSLGVIVNTHDVDYRDAIPVLLRELPKTAHPLVKEWIVRALTVRWARPAAALPLIEEFHRTDDEYMRWVIGNALETVADSSVAPQLIEIAGDSRYGASRQMVVVALGRVGGPDAMPLLLELLHDDEVAGHALIALGKVGDENARAAIQPFLEDANSWKRREARKALKAIDKRAGAVRPAR